MSLRCLSRRRCIRTTCEDAQQLAAAAAAASGGDVTRVTTLRSLQRQHMRQINEPVWYYKV